ncbi:MAG: CHAT domain-containing protein [Pacificimonas sp.]|jgi:tetratricopeptide (TPR) repeat protein|nr:CHAT domain-containing protein [Pacificimonas sp.]
MRAIRAVVAAALMAFGLAAPGLSQSAQPPTAQPPTAAQLDRLEDLRKAADEIDVAADTEANRAGWQRAIDYARSIYPADHPVVASFESELSLADYFAGDVPTAIERLERWLPVIAAGGPDYEGDVIDSQNALVVMYMKTGRTEDALAMAGTVLEQRRRQYAASPDERIVIKEMAAALNNVANAQNEIGNYDRAVEFILESAEVADRLEGTVPNAAVWYANVPIFLARAGRMDEAFVEARANLEKIGGMLPEGHPYIAAIYNTFANMAAERQKFADAEAAGRRAIEIASGTFGPDHFQTSGYRAALARILAAQGKSAEALEISDGAYEAVSGALGPTADLSLLARTARAEALFAEGRFAAALDEASAVYAQHRKSNQPGHRDRIASGELVAAAQSRLGRDADAYRTFYAVQQARRDIFPADSIQRLAGEVRLGQLAARAGVGDARYALASAADMNSLAARLSLGGGLPASDLRDLQGARGWALEAALDLGEPAAIFAAAQQMLDGPADRAVRLAALRDASPADAARIRAAQNAIQARQRLARQYLRAVGSGVAPAQLESISADLAAFDDSAVAGALPELALSELDTVRSALSADEALLLAVPGPERLAVLAVTAETATVHSAPLTRQQVAALAGDLRGALGAGNVRLRGLLTQAPESGADAYDFAPGAALHAAIFSDAIQGALAGKSSLAVAAGGALSRVPFAVLAPAPADGRLASADWLIRRHGLSSLASLGAPASSAAETAPRGRRVIAIGAPDLGENAALLRSAYEAGSQLADLPSLPEAQAELDAIAAAIDADERVLLIGGEAREEDVTAALSRPSDVVAFATHGLLDGELAGLSEPALALTPGETSDGLLLASEIAALPLDTDWVVLSACNTGGPGYAGASGLSGLASAFLYAGARNLLVSHWEVADEVAARLTVPTVRARYRDGTDPGEGLRQAQLALIDGPEARFRHPAFWAPFVYVGGNLTAD